MGGKNSIASGLSALAEILEREKRRGAGTIALSPESERLLRAMPGAFKQAGRPVAAASPSRVETKPAEPARSTQPRVETVMAMPLPTTEPERSPVLPPARRFPIPTVAESDRTEAWVRAQLNAIFKAVKNCPDCRGLGTLFETVVFATGNPQAEIMFVGDAPEYEEEKERKPFVGPAGQKLDQILKAMGLPRGQVYLTNILKFRPKKGDGRFQSTSDRPPQQDEMAVSLPYVRAEISVVRPRVIVALGRTAAEGLLEKGGSLPSFREAEHEIDGIPVIVTCDLRYVLRQESEGDAQKAKNAKRLVWEDMLRVMDRVGLPVSEKQRNYFL
jgi:uracil-DNA glycosylase